MARRGRRRRVVRPRIPVRGAVDRRRARAAVAASAAAAAALVLVPGLHAGAPAACCASRASSRRATRFAADAAARQRAVASRRRAAAVGRTNSACRCSAIRIRALPALLDAWADGDAAGRLPRAGRRGRGRLDALDAAARAAPRRAGHARRADGAPRPVRRPGRLRPPAVGLPTSTSSAARTRSSARSGPAQPVRLAASTRRRSDAHLAKLDAFLDRYCAGARRRRRRRRSAGCSGAWNGGARRAGPVGRRLARLRRARCRRWRRTPRGVGRRDSPRCPTSPTGLVRAAGVGV